MVSGPVEPSVIARSEINQRVHAAMAIPDFWGVTDKGECLPPLCVEIQPTAHCHRTCSFCSHIIRNRRGGSLTEHDIHGLLDQLRDMRVPLVAFSGGGEPLHWANGDIFATIARAAESFDVSLTTSGDQLLDSTTEKLRPEAAQVLRSCSAIYLNIPAVDEQSFARQVRGPLGWHHTSRMLRDLVELRDGMTNDSHCVIVGVVVLSTFNISQVAEIDRVLSEHGVDAIYYKQWKNFEKRNVAKVKLADQTLLASLRPIRPSDRSADLARFIVGLEVRDEEHHPCWSNRLSYDAIVDPDGDVYLCTPTVGKPEHAIGNLDDGPFPDLWASARRTRRLRVLNTLSATGVCPSECRHHRDNSRLDRVIARGSGG
ncbi:MAG: radical SAM protein [Nocardioidaceae bacterium]